MWSRGLSLVEMVVVIAIVTILATVGTYFFNKQQKGFPMEAQTRLIFSELLEARARAIYQRRGTRVKLYADRFEVYSSQQDGGRVAPVRTLLFTYPVTSSVDLADGSDIDFEETGISFVGLSTICLESVSGYGGVDSVIVATTRVSIGKKDKGDDCKPENITLK
ncbi:prepilin-type N-terminal cleavage/methylation domain-containing protein [Geomonas oryzisoli]|uniref:Prepilin-type N-terminal cleavage/methylation domain-containing protein n=1 Tax=Geomonas oryzisoli TaxID=2847992 RepID=A0ABX8J197_9BACT|nr:prepilin-type N-terminal cleavage/methylation domain-containing protein [Geomonas oryzisoli]QWV92029.1 prepilin-type N-terminal cleavage/methylation domain-containing protein [Geomonas oryzisoli]